MRSLLAAWFDFGGTLASASRGRWLCCAGPLGLVAALTLSLLAAPAPQKLAPLDCTGEDGVSAADVQKAQEAWAKYLGRKVEETVEIAAGVKMTFVLVPPGKFLMGSPKDEKERGEDETLHEVTLTEPFDLAITETTQAQYRALGLDNPSYFKGNDLPVETVSWEEAQDWAEQLTTKRGDKHQYRLPTEAEWEYSCRGGRSSARPFGIGAGRALSSRQANFDGSEPYGGADKRKSLAATCAVASYPGNAFGLHDLHGNVWEWCADWHRPYPNGTVINPIGPSEGSSRVIPGVAAGVAAAGTVGRRSAPGKRRDTAATWVSASPAVFRPVSSDAGGEWNSLPFALPRPEGGRDAQAAGRVLRARFRPGLLA
jgi:formylglycine-generating enzyme required for sulfatase activity